MNTSFSPLIFPDYESLSRHTASELFVRISRAMEQKKRFVVGMATGNSPIGTYKHLIELFKEFKGDLSEFYTVNLDEYYPMDRSSKDSYYQYMKELFWAPLAEINPSFNGERQGIILNGSASDASAEALRYETVIQELGGIDVQLLGIGTNGHIGFNEPGQPGDSRTGLVKLAEETIQVNKAHFGGDADKVPVEALSMGIGTIMDAREIILIASGESKAPILSTMMKLTEPTDDIPASFLLKHPKVYYFIDEAAAKNVKME